MIEMPCVARAAVRHSIRVHETFAGHVTRECTRSDSVCVRGRATRFVCKVIALKRSLILKERANAGFYSRPPLSLIRATSLSLSLSLARRDPATFLVCQPAFRRRTLRRG